MAYYKFADEFVKLRFVKSFCLQLLCYCTGGLDITVRQVEDAELTVSKK